MFISAIILVNDERRTARTSEWLAALATMVFHVLGVEDFLVDPDQLLRIFHYIVIDSFEFRYLAQISVGDVLSEFVACFFQPFYLGVADASDVV